MKHRLFERAAACVWVFACALALVASPLPARAAKKALIVAINDYQNVSDLETPLADGAAMQAKLQELGFKVTLVKEATRDEFRARWAEFRNDVTREDDIVFYFAGHGVQIDSLNYLLMRSSPGLDAGRDAIVAQNINFHEILDELQARARRAIFILDACRNDPFGSSTRARSVLGQNKGLAALEPVFDTFIMYSAGPNQFALDKPDSGGNHSVYMAKLLPILAKPDLSLVDVAKRVQGDVFSATEPELKANAQRPAYFDGILGNYFLAKADNGPAIADTESLASDKVVRIGGFATWDADCQARPAPRIAVLNPPKYGHILLRFERFAIAGQHFGVACERRVQRGIAVYYVVDEPDRASTAVDTVKLSVRHWSVAPATTVEETFEIDLATRYSKRVTTPR